MQINIYFFSDLSKNRFSELPEEVTDFHFLERLQCYHNAIRLIPDSISSLQCLNFLDLSRNQLTALPREICLLPIQVKIFKFKIINLNKITTIIMKLFYEYCLMTAPVFHFKRYSTEVCCTFINIKIYYRVLNNLNDSRLTFSSCILNPTNV